MAQQNNQTIWLFSDIFLFKSIKNSNDGHGRQPQPQATDAFAKYLSALSIQTFVNATDAQTQR